jgi:hypothetical protein
MSIGAQGRVCAEGGKQMNIKSSVNHFLIETVGQAELMDLYTGQRSRINKFLEPRLGRVVLLRLVERTMRKQEIRINI